MIKLLNGWKHVTYINSHYNANKNKCRNIELVESGQTGLEPKTCGIIGGDNITHTSNKIWCGMQHNDGFTMN